MKTHNERTVRMTLGTLIDRKTAYEDLPEVLTPKEVSEYLGMHVKSIRHCITDGRLRAFRSGSRYYVRKDWLRDFQNSMTVAPPNPEKLVTQSDLEAIGVCDGGER